MGNKGSSKEVHVGDDDDDENNDQEEDEGVEYRRAMKDKPMIKTEEEVEEDEEDADELIRLAKLFVTFMKKGVKMEMYVKMSGQEEEFFEENEDDEHEFDETFTCTNFAAKLFFKKNDFFLERVPTKDDFYLNMVREGVDTKCHDTRFQQDQIVLVETGIQSRIFVEYTKKGYELDPDLCMGLLILSGEDESEETEDEQDLLRSYDSIKVLCLQFANSEITQAIAQGFSIIAAINQRSHFIHDPFMEFTSSQVHGYNPRTRPVFDVVVVKPPEPFERRMNNFYGAIPMQSAIIGAVSKHKGASHRLGSKPPLLPSTLDFPLHGLTPRKKVVEAAPGDFDAPLLVKDTNEAENRLMETRYDDEEESSDDDAQTEALANTDEEVSDDEPDVVDEGTVVTAEDLLQEEADKIKAAEDEAAALEAGETSEGTGEDEGATTEGGTTDGEFTAEGTDEEGTDDEQAMVPKENEDED
uniref:Uncharacterized protein n=1 Tax=Octactis speculum TaxID=3111310 RepID=A0A7S2BQ80_9STRA|mmetsp:Transcript_25637/g.35266  ORF Transcript_25637/g.35266 Transcript_25637/m.35266 type:complete len:470 (+) Transcript_25637:130-1539(+)|eukprot:CAMPEP_0185748140 /NCGR_PEP_ID=MMETSP1174-20130828/6806_1 /TAXON_ID=35687 /ORGANISM="Dictyocha speculum, Strain CCMP1381" /LENGTH=469 /DNA_ID=CAMNT_0028423659 /DNA_START=142 /DNA_END=1551 /DNA_ORIENTATION=+